ncbi:hypothetical protein [Candidatus Venteria ishoeyi]|uniref:hypothetical protein n=1 Tax=Candidatus Venteria ishoeyi TaxID=1899563 RepID=UPI000CDEEDDE|nr:hypothetical protein [Candidatus Venteria ishoeyi]
MQDFYSFSRRENRRIASYVTVFRTQEMEKKTSQVAEVIKFSLLSRYKIYYRHNFLDKNRLLKLDLKYKKGISNFGAC